MQEDKVVIKNNIQQILFIFKHYWIDYFRISIIVKMSLSGIWGLYSRLNVRMVR